MNVQKPEPRIARQTDLIELHSIFHTIQGEGPFAGERAIFVRLAGCNLQCPLCDTEYTEGRTFLRADGLLQRIDALHDEHGTTLIVITGGEPFRQDLNKLVWKILASDNAYHVQIETNGTLPVSCTTGPRVTIVCSPKMQFVHESIREAAAAWKYVVTHGDVSDEDGLPRNVLGLQTKAVVARPPSGAEVYVQPADNQDDVLNSLNMHTAVNSCLVFGYTLCLQMHKYAELP